MNESVKMAAVGQVGNDGGSKRNSPSPTVDDMTDDDTATKKQRSNGKNGSGALISMDDDANEVAKSMVKSLDI